MQSKEYLEGYSAGYSASHAELDKLLESLIKNFYVYERVFLVYRSRIRELVRDPDLKAFIDRNIFARGVKSPRKSVEFLLLGNWGKFYEPNYIINITNIGDKSNLDETAIIGFIIEYMRKQLIRSL